MDKMIFLYFYEIILMDEFSRIIFMLILNYQMVRINSKKT